MTASTKYPSAGDRSEGNNVDADVRAEEEAVDRGDLENGAVRPAEEGDVLVVDRDNLEIEDARPAEEDSGSSGGIEVWITMWTQMFVLKREWSTEEIWRMVLYVQQKREMYYLSTERIWRLKMHIKMHVQQKRTVIPLLRNLWSH